MYKKRVALIHDWLTGMRGGEKVLERLCLLFPEADVFTLLHVPGSVSQAIERHRIITSPLQYIPKIDRLYRYLLPLMPWAINQLDFSNYDLLISTSHCVAKAAQPRPGASHWSYCHTPMRYIWDQYDHYFGGDKRKTLASKTMAYVRPLLQAWDIRTADRVHHFLANSKNVQERIQRIYHRSSEVVYPPVEVKYYSQDKKELNSKPFYLIVTAFAPYKRIDLAIETFNQLQEKLIIIGDGQEAVSLKKMAGPTIEFKGWLNSDLLRWHYTNAQALLFPGEEDFGIVPVEAMSAGCPVIAYKKGGALETIKENKTGLFFEKQSIDSLKESLERFKQQTWDRDIIRSHALQFDSAVFDQTIRTIFVEYLHEMS